MLIWARLRYALIFTLLVLAFAVLVTVHFALSIRLALKAKPRWRGVLAFFLPPLAPIWAMREGWYKTGGIWIAAFVLYLITRIVAER